MIILAALVIIVESIRGILVGRPLLNLDTGVIIIGVASVVNFFLGLYLIRAGRTNDSLTIVADGKHVLTDAYTSFGVVAGLLVVYVTGWQLLDPLIALAVAVNIIYSGFRLIRQSVGGLMNESDQEVLSELISRLNEHRRNEWIDVHQLRTWKSGDRYFIDFHLTIPYYWSVSRAHEEHLLITDSLKNLLKGKAEVFIHLDPCLPSCCNFCTVHDCNVRGEPFRGRDTGTVEHAVNPPGYKTR